MEIINLIGIKHDESTPEDKLKAAMVWAILNATPIQIRDMAPRITVALSGAGLDVTKVQDAMIALYGAPSTP